MITSKDNTDITGNMNTATESVCPKGWTLPTIKQLDNNRDTTNFSPVLGGSYTNGTLNSEATYGYWWGSEADNGARRYSLRYDGSSLSTRNGGRRHDGTYVRCVSEEKTVTDLTYLQDMTGEIADKINPIHDRLIKNPTHFYVIILYMKMFLDTSTDTVILRLDDKEYQTNLGHDMAEKLLGFIHEKLQENNKDFKDITEIDFNEGPGSFTGLRIGATIANTLIHELNLNQPSITPNYGRPANITKPKK